MAGMTDAPNCELSLVIPVYNASATIGWLVEQVHATFGNLAFEIILVNDGSADASEEVCNALIEEYPGTVRLVQLARNFGEHNAVMAGLKFARGEYVAVMDDDGQNLPDDVLTMLRHARQHNLDVVYGRYRQRRHSWLRRLGSWFNDRVANLVLDKPRGLYLSSFKVMSRFVVEELIKFPGPFLYLDGLILRITRNLGEIGVTHRPRRAGRSGYTLARLVGLWLNMFLGFSVVPLRLVLAMGTAAAAAGLLMLGATVVDKLWINPHVTAGVPSVLACVTFFAGVQLMVLGTLGEYVGRIFLQQNSLPQYVVRYVRRKRPPARTPPRPRAPNGQERRLAVG